MERNTTINKNIEIISPPEKVDMADDWYNFANLNHFWIQARFDALKTHLSEVDLSGTRLFEVGCGNGLIINQFEDAFNTTVDGCDLNMLALNQAKDNRGKLYCLNIFESPQSFIKKYDGVLLMDVIEHIGDDNTFLNAACQFVKDEGIVMINVPAINSFFSKYDTAAGHKRRYDKEMMLKLFRHNNITPLSIAYWGLTMVPILLLRKLVLGISSGNNTIKTGFQPPNQLANRMLKGTLSLENAVFKSPFIGTSLIAIGKLNRK
jgi:2-polyprenyl-3-methyl-5-hydroxy-6-metoxy-1,4-benzoquinol methylase